MTRSRWGIPNACVIGRRGTRRPAARQGAPAQRGSGRVTTLPGEHGHPRPRPLPFPRAEPPPELPSGTPVVALEAALSGARRAERLPLPRWIGALAVGSVVGFLPWLVYLGFTLPAKVRAEHY